MSSHSPSLSDGAARWAWRLSAFILLYTTWVWAGMRPSFHCVAILAALALMAVVIRGGAGRALWRDPVFWLGLLFFAYLAVPWLNAGRVLYYDVAFQRWQYTPPPWPGWPFSFDRTEAGRMVAWFFPAWVLVLAVRSPLVDGKAALRLLHLIVISAGLLALFGVVQFLSGVRSIYGVTPLCCMFFASFPYANHAAAFFLMAAALAAGMLFRIYWRVRGLAGNGPSGLFSLVLFLCLTGACLSLSRAGILLSGVLGLGLLAYGWRLGRLGFSPADRFRFAVGALTLLTLAAASVFALGEQLIHHEFTAAQASPLWGHLNVGLSGRPHFVRAAWAMWLDHPWWGVGGWGYRHLVSFYVDPGLWPDLQKMGWANVHCDALQFLTEFGLAGASLLAAVVGLLAWPARRSGSGPQPLHLLAWVGLALVLVFSLVDLPFRCPAILYTWSVVLAALPKVAAVPSV